VKLTREPWQIMGVVLEGTDHLVEGLAKLKWVYH